jgi:hypothetical protein
LGVKCIRLQFLQAFPVPSQISASRSFATLPAYILLTKARISDFMLREAKHPEITDDIKFQNKCTSISMLIIEINFSSSRLELISFKC